MFEKIKRKLSPLLILTMAASLFISVPVKTDAKSSTITYPTAYCFCRTNAGKLLRIGNDRQYLRSVKSSNNNIIYVPKSSTNPSGINYNAVAPGTCILTYKLRKGGKTITAKQKYVVVKDCPYKQVKINGKDVTNKIASPNETTVYTSKKSYTLQWVVNPKYKAGKPDPKQDNAYSSSEPTLYKQKGSKKLKGDKFIHIMVRDKQGNYYGDYHFYISKR